MRTNIEAAAEIARQVRLRDIGGIIVCDFIDMNTEGNRNKVIATLEAGLRKDRTRSTIQSFSPLGLFEFTRKRVGKDLGGQLRGACPTCSGLGTRDVARIGDDFDRSARLRRKRGGHGEHVHIAASPNVAAQVEFWYEDELKHSPSRSESRSTYASIRRCIPETARCSSTARCPNCRPIRVGDEFEVELAARSHSDRDVGARGRERPARRSRNAANQAGNAMKIRIIDVDGSEILAEPRMPIAAAASSPRPARASASAAAAAADGPNRLRPRNRPKNCSSSPKRPRRVLGARPAIGISTTEEAEVEKTDPKANVAFVRKIARPRASRRAGQAGRKRGRSAAPS